MSCIQVAILCAFRLGQQFGDVTSVRKSSECTVSWYR